MAEILQQSLALDARYAPLRFQDSAFRTLYLRRRRQLLTGSVRSKDYLQTRSQILKTQFNACSQSIRSSITSGPGPATQPQFESSFNQSQILRQLSGASRPLHKGPPSIAGSLSESSYSHHSPSPGPPGASNKPPPPPTSYTFNGVFHIFDDHTQKVSRLFFLKDDKSRLATASADGRIVIRQLLPTPPSIIAVLHHKCSVIDMDVSETNELLVSAAQDATVRLWSLSHAQCIRSITLSSPHMPTLTKFVPLNNNFILVGTSHQTVQLINISTGRSVQRGTGKINGKALSLCFLRDMKNFWLGDDTGALYSFNIDMAISQLNRTNRVVVADGQPVHSLACRILPSLKKPSSGTKSKSSSTYQEDALLLVGAGSALWLFTISTSPTQPTGPFLTPQHSVGTTNVPRPVCQLPIRLAGGSVFAPLLTSSRWLVLAAGTSDQAGQRGENVVSLLALDSASALPDFVFTAGAPCVLTGLPGHSAPVSCLDFSYDETMLASADDSGLVIVWRR